MRHLAIVLLVALAGCSTVPRPPSGTVHHVVLCWLKQPGNAADRDRIIDASRTFADIPGVLSVSAGEAIPSERPIVDDSFDVAILLTFANAADLAAYLAHPEHIRARDEILVPRVAKILVYDFTDRIPDRDATLTHATN